MLKKVTAFILILSFVFSIAGCSVKEAAETSKSTVTAKSSEAPAEAGKISIGTSPYPAWYVWYIAQEEGIFKKYGLNIELVYFPVYSDSLQAFNSGKIDMLNIATADIIAPYNSGVDFKTILINDNSNGADGLVAKSKYNTIADLKGQKVVTEYGTIEHFFLLKALASAGLSETDVQYTNMSVNDSGTAMVSGTVEAACVWEPSLTMALNNGTNKLLYSSEQTPGLIPDLLVSNGKLIKKNRADVLNILNAWFDSLDFYNKDPDKAIKDMAKYAEVSEADMKGMMAGSKLFSLKDNLAAMTEKQDNYTYLPYSITDTAKFLNSVKMVDKIPEKPEDLIDSSLLQEIAKSRESAPAPDTKALAKK